jgi:hypothetical protein
MGLVEAIAAKRRPFGPQPPEMSHDLNEIVVMPQDSIPASRKSFQMGRNWIPALEPCIGGSPFPGF